MHTKTCEILTGECGCVAGYSVEACKHVFALLHFTEHHVSLGHNKTCTSKRQMWHETVSKGEKIHPAKIRNFLFDRPHLEKGGNKTWGTPMGYPVGVGVNLQLI